jgi:hypothetical protein
MIVFIGNFTGTIEREFNIVADTLNESDIGGKLSIGMINDHVYTGSQIKPMPAVTYNGDVLTAGTDFKYIYGNNKDVGIGTVTVSFIGNFAGTIEREFNILEREITEDDIGEEDEEYKFFVGTIPDVIYNGMKHKPKPLVKFGTATLIENEDFLFEYGDNIDIGKGTVKIIFMGNFAGTIEREFNILEREMTQNDLGEDGEDDKFFIGMVYDVTYNGSKFEPRPIVKYGNKELEEGKDFNYVYGGNTEVGKGTVTIVFTGNFSGSVVKEFNILERTMTEDDIGEEDEEGKIFIGMVYDVTYNGSKFEPRPIVKYGNKELEEGKDFNYVYGANVNVGKGTVTIQFTGNFSGYVVKEFNILERTMTEDDIGEEDEEGKFFIGTVYDVTYNRTKFEPRPIVKYGDKTLVEGIDFEYVYGDDNKNVGKGTVKIVFIGNYSGTIVREFSIFVETLTESDIGGKIGIGKIDDQMYTGSQIKPRPAITYNGDPLIEDTDFEYVHISNLNVGKGIVIMVFINNFSGMIGKDFIIFERTMTEDDIGEEDEEYKFFVGTIPDVIYNGMKHKPEPIVKFGKDILVEGKDFEYIYGTNVDVGKGTVTIVFIGNFSGTIEREFNILKRTMTQNDLGEENEEGKFFIGMISNVYYNGLRHEPEPIVKYGTFVLVKDEDFRYVYGANVNIGKGTVTVEFIGNYAGSVVREFSILTKPVTDEDIGADGEDGKLFIGIVPDRLYNGRSHEPKPIVKYGNTVLVEGRDFNYVYGNNTNVGKGTVTVVFIGNFSGSVVREFGIIADALTNADIGGKLSVGSIPDQRYTGSQIRPKPVVTYNGFILVEGRDYTLTYGENLDVGKGTVKVSFIGGNLVGSVTVEFNIVSERTPVVGSNIPPNGEIVLMILFAIIAASAVLYATRESRSDDEKGGK